MNCGIHQGGHHSLLNYVTFIKSLLIELNKSNLSIKISEIGCTLIGYADDMSAATTSKNKMNKVMSIVGNHGDTSAVHVKVRCSSMVRAEKTGLKVLSTLFSVEIFVSVSFCCKPAVNKYTIHGTIQYNYLSTIWLRYSWYLIWWGKEIYAVVIQTLNVIQTSQGAAIYHWGRILFFSIFQVVLNTQILYISSYKVDQFNQTHCYRKNTYR